MALQTRKNQVIIALGANLSYEGDSPENTLRRALSALDEMGLSAFSVSPFYQTPCFPEGAGPDYINAAALLEAPNGGAGTAHDVLAILHEVEAGFGRLREKRWAGRTLDLDLIAMGDAILPDSARHAHWRDLPLEVQMKAPPQELVLPHPRLQDRGFVLVPLADIAPDWRHPILGKSVRQMLADLPDEAQLSPRRLEGS